MGGYPCRPCCGGGGDPQPPFVDFINWNERMRYFQGGGSQLIWTGSAYSFDDGDETQGSLGILLGQHPEPAFDCDLVVYGTSDSVDVDYVAWRRNVETGANIGSSGLYAVDDLDFNIVPGFSKAWKSNRNRYALLGMMYRYYPEVGNDEIGYGKEQLDPPIRSEPQWWLGIRDFATGEEVSGGWWQIDQSFPFWGLGISGQNVIRTALYVLPTSPNTAVAMERWTLSDEQVCDTHWYVYTELELVPLSSVIPSDSSVASAWWPVEHGGYAFSNGPDCGDFQTWFPPHGFVNTGIAVQGGDAYFTLPVVDIFGFPFVSNYRLFRATDGRADQIQLIGPTPLADIDYANAGMASQRCGKIYTEELSPLNSGIKRYHPGPSVFSSASGGGHSELSYAIRDTYPLPEGDGPCLISCGGSLDGWADPECPCDENFKEAINLTVNISLDCEDDCTSGQVEAMALKCAEGNGVLVCVKFRIEACLFGSGCWTDYEFDKIIVTRLDCIAPASPLVDRECGEWCIEPAESTPTFGQCGVFNNTYMTCQPEDWCEIRFNVRARYKRTNPSTGLTYYCERQEIVSAVNLCCDCEPEIDMIIIDERTEPNFCFRGLDSTPVGITAKIKDLTWCITFPDCDIQSLGLGVIAHMRWKFDFIPDEEVPPNPEWDTNCAWTEEDLPDRETNWSEWSVATITGGCTNPNTPWVGVYFQNSTVFQLRIRLVDNENNIVCEWIESFPFS